MRSDRGGDLQPEAQALLGVCGPLRNDGPEGEDGQRSQKIPEVLPDTRGRGRISVLVDQQDAEEEEGQSADEDVADEGEARAAFGFPFGQGQGDGHSDDEEEAGEDDVGQRERVHLRGRVPEDEGDGLHSRDVVDEDHGQDVETSERVEAGQPFLDPRRRGGGDGHRAGWSCHDLSPCFS